MQVRRPIVCAILVLLAALGGCARHEPETLRVDGRNLRAFSLWRGQAVRQCPPQTWRDFNKAVNELRLRAMARGITGSDAIGEAISREINGLTIDDVLRLGYEAQLERLEAMRSRLKEMVDGNALLTATPGDAASAEALAQRRADQEGRLRTIVGEIVATRTRLLERGPVPDGAPDLAAAPARLSRERALQEFAAMMARRRELAIYQYGDWPARVDRDGTSLPAAERELFEQKRAEARLNRHSVIPVYIRAAWRIYDAEVMFPEFSGSVTGNLTAEDREEIRLKWSDSEAEIWARKEASKETHDVPLKALKDHFKEVIDAQEIPVGKPAPIL